VTNILTGFHVLQYGTVPYLFILCALGRGMPLFFYLSARPLEEANPRSLPDPLDSKTRKKIVYFRQRIKK